MASQRFHPNALVESSTVGAGTRVWAFAHVLEGAQVGENCNIGDHAFLETGCVVGDNVTIKNQVCLWNGVHVEDDVFIGPMVAFTNDRYPRSPRGQHVREHYQQEQNWLRPTTLRRGCSVGANATILPGVELGEYCVVAAGAVVTADVAPFALVAGSPARAIGSVCKCGASQKADGSANCHCDSESAKNEAAKNESAKNEAAENESKMAEAPAAIPLVDVRGQNAALKSDVMAAIEGVVSASNFILGKEVELFEEEFAAFCGARHCVGVANGSEALHLSLRAMGIGAGDEVITAGNSFAASALAILYAGAEPVLVDVRADDFNLDPDMLERAITPRTKAIVPVHLYGQPARMDEIREIAQRHSLKIVEDACQAHGAEFNGQRTGGLGDAGCFSFYPGKNLGAFGDGGAIVTNDEGLADQLRVMRNYGQRIKNQHETLGYNCRLDTLQAAVLLVKLARLEEWTRGRQKVAEIYRRELAGIPDLILPLEREEVSHAYHLFVVRHHDRDGLLKFLASHQVFGGVHYPHPLNHAQPFESSRCVPDALPQTSRVAAEILSLPMYPELGETEIKRIAELTAEYCSSRSLQTT